MRRKSLILAAFVVLWLASLAGGVTPVHSSSARSAGVWRFGARAERFVLLDIPRIPFPVRVSESCGSARKGRLCSALDAAGRASDPAFRAANARRIPASRGGAEPGSRICRSIFRGTVMFADDARGNRNAFCSFRDGSRVSTGSLWSVWAYQKGSGSR